MKKLTVYNKDFIDWSRVQQQFCLTLERSVAISLRLRATEPRELESNKKTDVVFDPIFDNLIINYKKRDDVLVKEKGNL